MSLLSFSSHSSFIDPGPRGRALSLVAVVGSTFFLGLAQGIAYPITAVSFERWGAAAWLTGLAAGMPALAALVLLPVATRLASRMGLVPAMVFGVVLGVVGLVLMALWQGVGPWLAWRFVMGLGLLFPWLLGETWINTVASEASRGRVLSLYVVALFGGYGVGPVVMALVPTHGLAPFLIAGVALTLTALPLLAASRFAPPMENHGSDGLLRTAHLVPVGMMAALVAGVLEYAYLALLPSFALSVGVGEGQALLLVSAFLWGGVALSFPFGWLADRMDRERLFLLLLGVFILIAVPAGLAAAMPSLALPATFLLGGIACAFYTLGLAILGERLRPGDLASANAAFLVLYQLGTLGGPPLAGAAMDAWPPHGLVAAAVVFAALAALIIAALRQRRA
jgi:MFS family permease